MNIVVSYRGIPHAPGRETGASLARALRRLGHSVYEYGKYFRSTQCITSSSIPFTPDLLIYCECNDDDPQYMELKQLNVKHKVYWDFDIHTHPTRTLLFLLRMGFDFVFFANKLYESSFTRICSNSYFLPYAIDDEFHRRIPSIDKTVDVGLCGSPYPTRVELIEALNRGGIRAQLFTGVYGEDMVRLINSFKIHLNYNPTWGRGILNGRVWETTGCGTLLLTQREDFIDLFFEDGEHVILYQNTQDCIDAARSLLADDERLRRIAQQGYEHAHKNHSYIARANTILQTINEAPTMNAKHSSPLLALWEIARSIRRGGISN